MVKGLVFSDVLPLFVGPLQQAVDRYRYEIGPDVPVEGLVGESLSQDDLQRDGFTVGEGQLCTVASRSEQAQVACLERDGLCSFISWTDVYFQRELSFSNSEHGLACQRLGGVVADQEGRW